MNLDKLQLEIERIVASHEQLADENKLLHAKLNKLMQEQSSLLHEKDYITNKLKTIINRLKERLS